MLPWNKEGCLFVGGSGDSIASERCGSVSQGERRCPRSSGAFNSGAIREKLLTEAVKIGDRRRESDCAERRYVCLVQVKILFYLIRSQFGEGQPGKEKSREFPSQEGAECGR